LTDLYLVWTSKTNILGWKRTETVILMTNTYRTVQLQQFYVLPTILINRDIKLIYDKFSNDTERQRPINRVALDNHRLNFHLNLSTFMQQN